MKQIFIALLAVLTTGVMQGQTNYDIHGFSDKYVGKITVNEDEDSESSGGTIKIIDTKANKIIIKLEAYEIDVNLLKNKRSDNSTVKIQYDKQNILVYKDFNFDGEKDLAINEGNLGLYGSPIFQIYLAIDNTLKHSPEFTELAQEYSGLFETDYDKKIIYTFARDGQT